jgi:hypothetical protein
MPNDGGHTRWKYFGTNSSRPGFGPGHAYTPFFADHTFYDFHDNTTLDSQVAITDIEQVGGNSFSFTIHSHYAGVQSTPDLEKDTFIGEAQPDTPHGNASSLEAVQSDDVLPALQLPDARRSLIQWDLSSIPVGSTIHGATLELHVTSATNPTGYHIYKLKRPWDELQTSWNSPWASAGANSSTDRDMVSMDRVDARNTGTFVTALNDVGIAAIQDWVDHPGSNHGLIILLEDTDENTERMIWHSQEGSTPPELKVTYESSASITAEIKVLLTGLMMIVMAT